MRKPIVAQDDSEEWREYYKSLAALRNHAEGFWIAEADPDAPRHSKTKTVGTGCEVVLCTDGVSSAVDNHGLMNWQQLFERAQRPLQLVKEIQSIEIGDSARIKFPRSKISDDKAIARKSA